MPGSELYERFMALHARDGALVMPNAWDGLSALVLADAGFEAIATSSVGDFEDGYGDTAAGVAETVERAVEYGLAGIGIEDTTGNPEQPIRDFDDAVDRVRSAAAAAKKRIVTAGAPTPVNVLISPADKVLTVAELQTAGVKRISLGPALYTHAMGAIEQTTKALLMGDLASVTTGMSIERIGGLLARERLPQPGDTNR